MVMRSAMSQTVLGLAIGVPTVLLCVRFVETQFLRGEGHRCQCAGGVDPNAPCGLVLGRADSGATGGFD